MTAVEHAIAVFREKFPMDAERKQRLARSLRVNVRFLPQSAIDAYYGRMVNQIAGSFLDRLNDDELELRLDIDQRRLLDIDSEVGPQQEDEEDYEYKDRRKTWLFEREEMLEWTLKEVARRGGVQRPARGMHW